MPKFIKIRWCVYIGSAEYNTCILNLVRPEENIYRAIALYTKVSTLFKTVIYLFIA